MTYKYDFVANKRKVLCKVYKKEFIILEMELQESGITVFLLQCTNGADPFRFSGNFDFVSSELKEVFDEIKQKNKTPRWITQLLKSLNESTMKEINFGY